MLCTPVAFPPLKEGTPIGKRREHWERVTGLLTTILVQGEGDGGGQDVSLDVISGSSVEL